MIRLLLPSARKRAFLSSPNAAWAIQPIRGWKISAYWTKPGSRMSSSITATPRPLYLWYKAMGAPSCATRCPPLKPSGIPTRIKASSFSCSMPTFRDNRGSINQEAEAFGYDMPILIDQTQIIGEGPRPCQNWRSVCRRSQDMVHCLYRRH